MPRNKSYETDDLARSALALFWMHGYGATSMDDLVKATGVSRHGIYSDFGGKRSLFLACFDTYRTEVVDPAFAPVEKPNAGMSAIAAYFETQIALAEQKGLPGPGCFVANAQTETAPHDEQVGMRVRAHNARLYGGFRNVLRRTAERDVPEERIQSLASTLVIFANGLWSMSRTVTDAAPLRQAVKAHLELLQQSITE